MISVICSIYNSEKYLPKYLELVNSQFLKEFEIVFVDANSTDNSPNIIKNACFRDGITTKILTQQSRISIYQAWNAAIKKSSHDYVVNWNTDDVLFPTALETYQSYINNFPGVDLFYSPYLFCRDQDSEECFDIDLVPAYSHQQLLNRCICGPFPLLKKSTVAHVGYFDEKYISSGDYAMWLKMSKNKCVFKKIPEIIGCFTSRTDSVSQSKMNIAQREDQDIRCRYS